MTTPNRFNLNGCTYSLLYRNCNKPRCKCRQGQPHGPYWYVQTSKGLEYIGKTLPEAFTNALDAIYAASPMANKAIKTLDERHKDLLTNAQEVRRKSNILSRAIHGDYISKDDFQILAEFELSMLIPPQSPTMKGTLK